MQKIFSLFIVLIIFGISNSWAEETPWPVPDDKNAKVAPFDFDDNSRKVGEDLYMKNCKSCHGDVGLMNMIPLDPLPKDMSIDQVANQSDGAMYYKIANGRGAMPSFKNTLSVNDTWSVVAYIRSFHKGYTQPVPEEIESFAGAVTLLIEWLAEEHKLNVLAIGKEDEKDVPAEGVEVALFVERYFGQLKIGDAKLTNKNGVASFQIDGKLPGDSIGTLSFIAKVVDIDSYGEVVAEAKIVAGEPTSVPGITEKRAMWNVGSKAPWWVTIAYPAVVLTVLGFIVYVMFLLKKVNDLGKKEEA